MSRQISQKSSLTKQVQLLDLPESASNRHRTYGDRFTQQDPLVDVYMIGIPRSVQPQYSDISNIIQQDAATAIQSIISNSAQEAAP